ncbi:Sir2 family NAD-dependent protein deacetylase [Shewanella youngdeokensis]|uniref:protein acetyllysine N-acetyltransferase n=1 Tax=Shewanella youngdeokensis TaxID=2999068 RepID=A0ABZ0K3Y1_9GAMM|nr:Sir2 family NAD-dependent protein deacetylase [Shewanella sp. DAU334]
MKHSLDNKQDLALTKQWLEQADAIVIGAGAGLSAAAGLVYGGARFEHHFAQYRRKYGLTDMYSAGFFPFATPELKWAYWSRHILINRFDTPQQNVYSTLHNLVAHKPHFVITTNADGLFGAAGFDSGHIFTVQGDYGKLQCATPCHDVLYDNEAQIRSMVAASDNGQVPTALVPQCPRCGGPMEVNIRKDATFVQDDLWVQQCNEYERFIEDYADKKLVLLELGIGFNTPSIIKFPFNQMTEHWPQTHLVRVNLHEQEAQQWQHESARHLVMDASDWLNAITTAV